MILNPSTIISATEDLFSCVSMSASPGLPYLRTDEPANDSITGIIHLSGKAEGYAALHMSLETAKLIVRDFLFLEEEDIETEALVDAVCELVNILAGRIKAYIDPTGGHFKLSLPSICWGKQFAPTDLHDADKVTLPFYLDDGEFFVEIQLAENPSLNS